MPGHRRHLGDWGSVVADVMARQAPEGLRGGVVLVDFWTCTCVNRLRTLPNVRAWAAKYAAQGLTTIGVHTPEFDFGPQASERSECAGAPDRSRGNG